MKKLIVVVISLVIPFYSLLAQRIRPQSETEAEDKTLSPYFYVQGGDTTLDQLPLYSTKADVNIAGIIADVKVTQVYKNTGKKPIEAIYVFPASTRAAVYGMTMTIGERVLKAEIQERKKARETYEKAKQEGKSASLLEQERPNVFQMNVANIMPGDTIIVELYYTELLIPTDKIYEFVYPTVVGPRYSNKSSDNADSKDNYVETPYGHEGEKPLFSFDLKIHLTSGAPFQELFCSTHKLNVEEISNTEANIELDKSEKFGGNRDFVLNYRLAGDKIQTGLLLSKGDKENFFLLMLQPTKRIKPEQIPQREYIFVVDVSGSMNGYPLNISKKMLKKLLEGLRSTDKFNILLFAGSSELFSEESVEASSDNIEMGINFINKQQGGGGTELLPALKNAFALPKDKGCSRTIAILTDGYVDVEYEAFELIRKSLDNSNVFAFGIGTSVNRFLIEGIARMGLGEPFVVTKESEADEKAEKFRKYIDSPIMTDIKVEYDGFLTYDVEPVSIPDVLSDRPIIIYGKWLDQPTGTIIVSGLSGKERLHVDIGLTKFAYLDTSQALKYLWARNRIALLSDYNQLRSNPGFDEKITELGLKYNLLTNYTSFVAVDYLIRNEGDSAVTVKQALPMPDGVSDDAIGKKAYLQVAKSSYSGSSGGMVANPLAPSTRTQGVSSSGEENPLKPGVEKSLWDVIVDFFTPDEDESLKNDSLKIKIDTVETPPKFNMEFLKSTLKYPESARNAGIEGIVLIRALIRKDGKVKEVKIEYSDSKVLEKEAINAVWRTPFEPATKGGIPIDSYVSIPITFKLKDSNYLATWDGYKGNYLFKDVKIGIGKTAEKGSKIKFYDKTYSTAKILLKDSQSDGTLTEIILGEGKYAFGDFEEIIIGMKPGGIRYIELIQPYQIVKWIEIELISVE